MCVCACLCVCVCVIFLPRQSTHDLSLIHRPSNVQRSGHPPIIHQVAIWAAIQPSYIPAKQPTSLPFQPSWHPTGQRASNPDILGRVTTGIPDYPSHCHWGREVRYPHSPTLGASYQPEDRITNRKIRLAWPELLRTGDAVIIPPTS